MWLSEAPQQFLFVVTQKRVISAPFVEQNNPAAALWTRILEALSSNLGRGQPLS
jgi:hypothetical protein